MARKCCILMAVLFLTSCSTGHWKPHIHVKITPGTVRNVVEMEENSVTMIKLSMERDW